MLLDSIERWMPVSGYGGTYEVSDHGRVRSLDHVDARGRLRFGRMLHFGGDDYRLVILCHLGHRKMMKVHRLVALAFVQNPDGKPHVNHKDCDTKNNHHSNLEWVTNLENMRHAWRNGLRRNCHGENHCRAKLKTEQVAEIMWLVDSMSERKIAKRYGVSRGAIKRIKSGRGWKHVTAQAADR